MDILPITLVGENLGERHKYLNDLVSKTYADHVPYESIKMLPELSAIDRLFKIDLANKYKDVDYILHTLKDEDMMFVSRALKCTWLLKKSFLICPIYLENELYPQMLATASNKMKHWVHLHLDHKSRCQVFYEYYKNKNLDLALKFLPKCSVGFFLKEMKLIPFNKITPHLLKLLCERSEKAAIIYFQELRTGGIIDQTFIQEIQFILKTHPKIYFDIIEKYFLKGFRRLNKAVTKYIMDNHKIRFLAKQELYTQRILDLPTLAKYFNSTEAKQLIIHLAKADYLGDGNWFTYKFCEPLIKRIDIREKNEFCNRTLKKKLIGEKCSEAPYTIPPIAEKRKLPDTEDKDTLDWKDYDSLLKGPTKFPKLRGGGGCALGCANGFLLEKLFDQYRFCNFERTFAEFNKLIFKESHYMKREAMLLVLVSKTGRRAENLETLLRWLVERFINEPCRVRAAVVRSLVKRAAVWRLPDSTWRLLLQFGHDLGLDGGSSDVPCREGLHCVVLRHLLLKETCPPEVLAAFLHDFSPLSEYSLNADEREIIYHELPELLLNSIQEKPNEANWYLTLLCDALEAYCLTIESYPEALTVINTFISNDPVGARQFLRWLFERREFCQKLFVHYFTVIQTDASYLNALRHDANILESKNEFEKLLTNNINELRHESFFRKLSIYFGEKDGLAEQYLTLLRQKATEQPHWRLARPIAQLARANHPLPDPLESSDESQQRSYKQMMQALNQNARLTRPKRCPINNNHKIVDPHALLHWVHTCSPVALQRELPALLAQGRTARLVLALRAPADRRLLAEALPHAARSRSIRALRIALRLLRRHPCEQTLTKDWTALKSLINNIDLKGKKFEVYCDLAKLNNIPKKIILEYCVTLYEALSKIGYGSSSGLSHRIALPLLECISDHFDSVDEVLIQNILNIFLNNDFTLKSYGQMQVHDGYWRDTEYNIFWPNMPQRALNGDYYNYVIMHLRILIHFLYSSDSVWIQTIRTRQHLKPFLKQVKNLWQYSGMREIFKKFLKLLNSTEMFLKPTVAHCSLTLDAVRSFCDEIAPMDKNFALHYYIRLVSLSQNAVIRCSKKLILGRRIINQHKIINKKEFNKWLPFYFGHYAALDLENLVNAQFQSIRMFYCDVLAIFMRSEFGCSGSIKVIEGLIYAQKPNAAVVGAILYNRCLRNNQQLNVEESLLRDELLKSLKSVPILEVKFFLNCDIPIVVGKEYYQFH